MNFFIKKVAAAVAACLCMLSLTACFEDDGSGGLFKYDISANPGSLDPQTASDANSDLLISSIYTGLLTVNPDGSLGEGVAEDYVVSDDGLVYTFKLRQDIYWVDKGDFEAVCTAHDFVYAFQRLFDPTTRAARASEYYCIKNAQHVNLGHIPDVSLIGVEALGDFELEITLAYPNPQFPVLLTKSPAMPCSEEYFIAAQGKYGLSAESTPSNGAFYVTTWAYDPYSQTDNNHLILRRNYKNNEASKIYPSGLNYFIVDEAGFLDSFLKGTTSCIAVTDEEAALISGNDYTVTSYSNISVGMIFNTKYELFANADMRRALASLVNRDDIALPLAAYPEAAGIVPYEVTLLDKSYRDFAGDPMFIDYNLNRAKHFYTLAEPHINKDQLVGARIILPDDTMSDAIAYIMQEWQKQFGFYCVVQVLTDEEYNARIQSGDYEIAVTELNGGYNSPEAYLRCFTRGSSENYSGYANSQFERLMKLASRAVELSDSADYYVQAEKLLIDEAAFVPLCCKNEYFFIGEDMSDIYYNPFTKTVDFSNAKVE